MKVKTLVVLPAILVAVALMAPVAMAYDVTYLQALPSSRTLYSPSANTIHFINEINWTNKQPYYMELYVDFVDVDSYDENQWINVGPYTGTLDLYDASAGTGNLISSGASYSWSAVGTTATFQLTFANFDDSFFDEANASRVSLYIYNISGSWVTPERRVHYSPTFTVFPAAYLGVNDQYYPDTGGVIYYGTGPNSTPTGTVTVTGYTYDAVNATPLGSVVVNVYQNSTYYNTTSNAGGVYSAVGLEEDLEITLNTSKSGWVGYPVYLTAISPGSYTVDLPLVPTGGPSQGTWGFCTGGSCTEDSSAATTTGYYNATSDGTGCGGIVYNEPYWGATSGSTVTLSNASWNASMSTDAGGWWQFDETADGLCGGTYTLTCSKSGYDTASTTVVCPEDEFTRKDTCLSTNYTLTVTCRDLDSSAVITDTDCYVELSTGGSGTTTDGVVTFNDVEYGVVEITGSAVGFYPGVTSCVMDGDKTSTCYLTSESQNPTNNTGLGVGYPPKTVRFKVQTIWGAPVTECLVNCTGYETTVGSWDWLYQLFGVDVNETPIATATMGGYTDINGDIDFVMFEPVKYNCTFVKAGECNETITLYPKDENYIIIAGGFGNTTAWVGGEDLNEAVTCNVTTATIDPTHANITVSYYDSSGGTTGGTCYLNQTNPLDRTGPEITVSSCAVAGNSWNHTFSVTDQAGESYFVRVQPTHSTWDFERDFSVTFPENQVNPLNLSDTELMFIAVFIILFSGLLFGAISAPHAPLIMCFLGWIFLAFGWMDAIALSAMAVLTLASVLAVLNLVMVRSKKERYI